MRKTLFLSAQGISPMHQATETELMMRRQEEGDEVYVIFCGAALFTCSLNATHNLVGCALCQQRAQHLANRVGIPSDNRFFLDRSLFPKSYPQRFPTTVNELMTLAFEGINIGRGAASSTISILREYALDLQGKDRKLVELELCNALGALLNYRRILDQVRPDEVILFNGRHAELLPLLELCRQRNINFTCHERGSSPQHFQEFVNELPHSISFRRKLLKTLWGSTPVKEREAGAIRWFEDKRKGTSRDDRSYLDGMEFGQLPQGYDKNKHNIVIFNSSEDEMQTISEWDTPLFSNQNEVVIKLLETLEGRDEVQVYLRMHPNLAVVNNQQTRELYELKQANFTLIGPREVVDSYTLCAAADVVLTFASTIGIEATYWGTASVLYGRSFYEGEDAVYEPQNFEELMTTLTTPELPPKPQVNTYKYGYFVSHYGKTYQYAKVHNPTEVTILGRPLKKLTLLAIWQFLLYLPQAPHWLRTHKIITGAQLKISQLTKLYSHLREKA